MLLLVIQVDGLLQLVRGLLKVLHRLIEQAQPLVATGHVVEQSHDEVLLLGLGLQLLLAHGVTLQ